MNQRVKYLGQRSFGSKVIVRAHNQTEETGSIFLRRLLKRLVNISLGMLCSVLFCSLAVLDPRVGHTMNVLSPFIPVLCHSRESPVHPRLDVVHPGRAWSSSPACTWHCSLHYLFLQATPLFPRYAVGAYFIGDEGAKSEQWLSYRSYSRAGTRG